VRLARTVRRPAEQLLKLRIFSIRRASGSAP
jgi:hypothetical protein